MSKKTLMIFVLCVCCAIGGVFVYKKYARKVAMQGRVIVFDGASSAGKSSVIRQLMPMLDSSYQYIAVDDFVTQVFIEQQKLKLPEKEFFDRVNQQSDLMYKKIKTLVADGKNVILDTVLSGLEGEKSVREQLEKLKGLPVTMVLVHCPLPVLVERIKQRNEKAARENKLQDERSIATAMSQFGHIYRSKVVGDEFLMGTISHEDVEYACDMAKKEWGENLERFDQFKAWLMSQLGVKDKKESLLTTSLKYDCIVDTSKYTSQKCAQEIRNRICSKIITINNKIQLYTEYFGNQPNPTILLISGAMASARFWIDEFCQQLAGAGYFVIRYDHRDMGLSLAIDYAKNPYTLDDLAKDAIAILDSYNIKKAHIVGHSMGGAIAQLMVLDYPSRVSSITLISSSALAFNALNTQEKEALEKTWQVLGAYNKPTRKFKESVDGFMQAYGYLHGEIPMDKDVAHNYIKDMYERSKPEYIAWFEKFSSGIEPLHNHVKAQQNIIDRTQDLKKIKVPVLAIHGQKDCLSFPRIAQEYCVKLVSQAKMHIIPGMGHMILSKALFAQIEDLVLRHVSEGKTTMKDCLTKKRLKHELPAAIAERGWRYHHLGIPYTEPRPGETHYEHLKVYVSGFETSPYGIEWMRFEKDCPVPDVVRKVPHVAFEVDDLDEALRGKEILLEPGTPSGGCRAAMIMHDGAPIELIEFRTSKEE